MEQLMFGGKIIMVGGCNFGYLNGSVLTVIKRYDGSLPNQNQV